MGILGNILLFLGSAAVVWVSAGFLIGSVERIARRFHKTGFTIAFFVLGLMTSLSEMSVAFNSVLDGVPQVSAGNLIGASFVIMLFIVPVLAITNRGISLRHTLSRQNLFLALVIMTLPVLVVLDGVVTSSEGWFILFAYMILLYRMKEERGPAQDIKRGLMEETSTVWDSLKIVLGAVLIFAAGHMLVEQAVYFADTLAVPRSLMGLILLAVGTNVPELVIAVRSMIGKHEEIAFGDYLGSTVANAPIFGLMAVANGRFTVEPSEFWGTVVLMVLGLVLFYIFAGSRRQISRKEGLVLISFYGVFLIMQLLNVVRFAG